MKYVEFYKLGDDGRQSVIAKCLLDESGAVRCEGDESLIKNLRKHGISNYSDIEQPKLFFEDGVSFLEQLKYNFKSGYLNASDIKE